MMASELAQRLAEVARTPKLNDWSTVPARVDAELQEVREVLESLATFSRPLCWCPQGTEAEPHTEICRRTSKLMSKVETK
jgi:hypothetical protein